MLGLELGGGYLIDALAVKPGVALLQRLEGLRQDATYFTFESQLPCINVREKRLYIVRLPSLKASEETQEGESPAPSHRIHRAGELAREYVEEKFRLLRMCEEGNLRLTTSYILRGAATRQEVEARWAVQQAPARNPFHVNITKVAEANQFIRSTRLPLSDTQFEVARLNMDQSYQVEDPGIAFLLCMMALEAILNPGLGEVSFRVARSAGVILGRTARESEDIMDEVSRLYSTRSGLVHMGKSTRIPRLAVLRAREIVRRLLLETMHLQITKKALLNRANRLGFGEWQAVGEVEPA
ncbi:MAG: hypothetical protein ACLPQ4_04125 [Thermoplasmata archaeon]